MGRTVDRTAGRVAQPQTLPPRSSDEFERGFRRAGAPLEWVTSVPLEAYPRIFRVEMDGELFSRVLAVVREDSAFAPKWLAAVGALSCAGMLAAQVSDEDRAAIRAVDAASPLLAEMEATGKRNPSCAACIFR